MDDVECECGAGPDGCMCGFARAFNAAEEYKRDLITSLQAENARLRAGPDWGEQYLREMDERKRQGDRAHKWKTRAEAHEMALRGIAAYFFAGWPDTDDLAEIARIARDAIRGERHPPRPDPTPAPPVGKPVSGLARAIERDRERERERKRREALADPPSKLRRVNDFEASMALVRALSRVREGEWFEGAPSHLASEVLAVLERQGFYLGVKDRA